MNAEDSGDDGVGLGNRLWIYVGLSTGIAAIGAGACRLADSASTGFVTVYFLVLALWVEKNGHYTNSFRAPAVLDAIKGTFADGRARTADFEVSADERYFHARIAVLPKAFRRDRRRRVVMEIHGRTAEHATEALRRDFVTNASHELRTSRASVLGYVETLKSGASLGPSGSSGRVPRNHSRTEPRDAAPDR